MLDFTENPTLLVILAVINIPVYYFIGKVFYKSWYEFTEGLRFLFQPGWLSVIRGEFTDDFWETLKLYAFFIFCATAVIVQYKIFA